MGLSKAPVWPTKQHRHVHADRKGQALSRPYISSVSAAHLQTRFLNSSFLTYFAIGFYNAQYTNLITVDCIVIA